MSGEKILQSLVMSVTHSIQWKVVHLDYFTQTGLQKISNRGRNLPDDLNVSRKARKAFLYVQSGDSHFKSLKKRRSKKKKRTRQEHVEKRDTLKITVIKFLPAKNTI